MIGIHKFPATTVLLAIRLSIAHSEAQTLPNTEIKADPQLQNHVPTRPNVVPAGANREWLYARWKKYGQWDYNQRSFVYRDFTLFDFGATGAAAGIDLQTLSALTRSSQATPQDIQNLDNPNLIANFTKNISAFDRLRDMAVEDKHLVRIAPDYTWLDTDLQWPRNQVGISDERWSEYKSLFQKLDVPDGVFQTDDFPGAIFFIARSKGLCTGGSGAGYVYSATRLSPTSEHPTRDLDYQARKNPNRHYAYTFQEIKPNWYAFYEVDW